jgi:hypothetical protein
MNDQRKDSLRRAVIALGLGSAVAVPVLAAAGKLSAASLLAGLLALAIVLYALGGIVATLFARGEPEEEPLSQERRRELIMEKNFLLASIRELEFDLALGKISEKDHREGIRVARDRALEVMRELDAAAGARSLIERELAERLAAQKIPAARKRAKAAPSEAIAPAPAPRACRACGVPLPSDARFCAQCGAATSPEHVS